MNDAETSETLGPARQIKGAADFLRIRQRPHRSELFRHS